MAARCVLEFMRDRFAFNTMERLNHKTFPLFPIDGRFGKTGNLLGRRVKKSICGSSLVLVNDITTSHHEFEQWAGSKSAMRSQLLNMIWVEHFLEVPSNLTVVDGDNRFDSASVPSILKRVADDIMLRYPTAPVGPILINCYPRQLAPQLAAALPECFEFALQNCKWKLHMVAVPPNDESNESGLLAWSLEGFEPDAVVTKFETTGFQKNSSENNLSERPSRAMHKIEEVIESELWPKHVDLSLDLGASPGGWTQAMSFNGVKRVIAIDPGALNSDVLALQGVDHIAKLTQQAGPDLRRLGVEENMVDVIVCDVNCNLSFTLQDIVSPMLKYLRRDSGLLVVTVKMVSRSLDNPEYLLEKTRRFLDGMVDLDSLRIVQLFANTIRERTIIVNALPSNAIMREPEPWSLPPGVKREFSFEPQEGVRYTKNALEKRLRRKIRSENKKERREARNNAAKEAMRIDAEIQAASNSNSG